MKHPSAQEIVDNCDRCSDVFWAQWVEWYNYRLKVLNPKPKWYGRTYLHTYHYPKLNQGGKTKSKTKV